MAAEQHDEPLSRSPLRDKQTRSNRPSSLATRYLAAKTQDQVLHTAGASPQQAAERLPAALSRNDEDAKLPKAARQQALGIVRNLTEPAGIHEMDYLIHERMRLGIVSALAVNDALSFSELKQLLGATDGNLSVHARKLEEAGLIVCKKYFEGRKPRTDFSLTGEGREVLERYLNHMESLIKAMREQQGG
jgi:DNA-binding HxlR family transcriptional regulator